jgi:Leucine-rich repeat (LRR) protein
MSLPTLKFHTSPITIYTLYEITNQAKSILNTYPDDATQIILYGEYIYLNMKMNGTSLETKQQYEDFQKTIKKIINKQYGQSLEETAESQHLIYNFYKEFIQISYDVIPKFDSCRWTLDLARFKNLKLIHLNYLYLYEIKNIPNGVNTFVVRNSFLKKIENIPNSLQQFCCNNNQLTKLPSFQNTNLKLLNFSNNQISSLCSLPDSVEFLCFNNNKIVNIPNFPKSLKHLECSWNKICNLECISKNIHTMIVDHNQIYQLPCLSDLHFLKTLICNSNHIRELPPLPGLIEYIDYSENPIKIFVPFPFSIIE